MVSSNGWIGVDLDGTLAHYEQWMGWNVFGDPVAPMVERVRSWLQDGRDVRIFTARVGMPLVELGEDGVRRLSNTVTVHKCLVTGQEFRDSDMIHEINKWCIHHIGQILPVTCVKDVHMIELWDDRCVQVVPNTGRTVAEEAEARYNADGKYSDFRGCE